MPEHDVNDHKFDYIVVGSGAGGGPLAANLAKAGCSVLLMEAGGRDENDNCQIPCWHGLATEDEHLKWDFYVRHYADEGRQRADSKLVAERDGVRRNGILYPRAGTLGGCTVHNAMITVYPHNSDWDYLAHLTDDPTWDSKEMRKYFERLERCNYYPGRGFLGWLYRKLQAIRLIPRNLGRHGFHGWLHTNVADPLLVFQDGALVRIVKSAAKETVAEGVGDPLARIKSQFDPNHWRLARKSPEGLAFTPLATKNGRRCSARDPILAIEKKDGARLTILTHALATKILLEGSPPRAVGVEFMKGESLYRADPRAFKRPAGPEPSRERVFAHREVILAAGAFNTPQLLMLSGIGPRDELERHRIPVVVDLPGVGKNLQDRYEVGVVTRVKESFAVLKGATFKSPRKGETGDPFYVQYQNGRGVYTTNGVIIGLTKRSSPFRSDPDLYIFGVPGYFKGYEPDYSKAIGVKNDYFTWAVLKAHTNNRAGTLTLRSSDPRDVPDINFRYFDEGDDQSGEDLESVVEGVLFARRMNDRIRHIVVSEEIPGPSVQTREEIRQFIKNEAWGHHASCTCKIGSDHDPMAVLDSKFRVRNVDGLRVVDASIFPRIPGFFIVTAIYMASEKAADVILQDAGILKRS